MKNILYTIILSFLFSSVCLADWESAKDAYDAGDYATAYKEFKTLAEQGDARAQATLGDMYFWAKGVTQDYMEAANWYRNAADQGQAKAQYNLGVMYGLGQGVIEDKVYAHMWGNILNSNGYEGGKKIMDYLLEQAMTPFQIQEAQRLARECVKKNYKGC